jgi:3-deoxy-D-manno-octulosonic acid (KDO) 8-phosphate synthase
LDRGGQGNHQDPDRAPSDGPEVPLSEMKSLLHTLMGLDELAKA